MSKLKLIGITSFGGIAGFGFAYLLLKFQLVTNTLYAIPLCVVCLIAGCVIGATISQVLRFG